MTDDDAPVELTTFQSKECYVYCPLPPVSSLGHRAELWDVDKWFKEVRLRVVAARDDLFVRLEDQETGDLFAECPLPSDGTPLTTACEPVVDSSRYFVLRVVDRSSGKHAFLGIGFRQRAAASNFTAALDDYRQYLRRLSEAKEMREVFEDSSASDGSTTSTARPTADLSLKPGETIVLKFANTRMRGTGGASIIGSSAGLLQRADVTLVDVGAGPGGALKLQAPPSVRPAAELQPTTEALQLPQGAETEEWGDFVG